LPRATSRYAASPPRQTYQSPMRPTKRKRRKGYEYTFDSEKIPFHRQEWTAAEIIAWAWENGRADVLAQFGIFVDFDF
jgi:hypothetical protein